MFNMSSFIIYALSTGITPGPNNIFSMSNGIKVGVKKALPFNFGIWRGFSMVSVMCALFCNVLTEFLPAVQQPMLFVGAGYMLYLAWETYKSADVTEAENSKTGFMQGLMLQFVNPNTYLYCIMPLQVFIIPYFSGNIPALTAFALLLAFIAFLYTLAWCRFGSVFKVLFSRYKRAVNTAMSLLLVYCALTLLIN